MSTVAVVTNEQADEEWVFRALDGSMVIVDAAHHADLLVVDAGLLPSVVELLPAETKIVVIGDPLAPPERAVHVVTRTWPDEHLRLVLAAVANGIPFTEPPLAAPSNPAEARDAQRAIAAARKLGTVTGLGACESAIVEILVELVEVDRAYCLYYDADSGSLWSEAKQQTTGDERRSTSGLAGFAALTGKVAIAARAGNDPRFVGAIDDANGDGADRVIAQPVFGADGAIHAVLVCARRGKRSEFGAREIALLARFARLVGPVLDQLSIDVHAQQILDEAAGDDGLFRRQAVQAQAATQWGDVVRVAPGWLSWAYWILVVLLAGTTVLLVVGRIATYSKGPALIRSNTRMRVTARTAGNIVAVEVTPGDRVRAGTVIARFDDTELRTAVDRLTREFERHMRNHMLHPADASADASVKSVRHDLEAARTALDERLLVAPSDGIVGDIRARPGQRVEPGDFVASILDASKGLEVVALLPGKDRPQLAPGMTIRLELHGYRYAYRSIQIDSVSSDVIAPAEARRVLGSEVADGVALTGPVVLVRGRLASDEFTIDGRTYKYHDGMLGTAEVRVRTEPLIYALIPATRSLQ